jgi:hypothetical protein
MTDRKDRIRVLRHLREFVEAVDRRLPQTGRSGEQRIVCEAARLRQTAVERILQLEKELLVSAKTHAPGAECEGTDSQHDEIQRPT